VRENMNKYVDNIQNYPKNEAEIKCATDYLNKLCYDDFAVYLAKRYPNIDLCRNPQPKSDVSSDDKQTSNYPKNMIIITEEEKNKLLKKETMTKQDELLLLLANPSILQFFSAKINDNKQIVFDKILTKKEVDELKANDGTKVKSKKEVNESKKEVDEPKKEVNESKVDKDETKNIKILEPSKIESTEINMEKLDALKKVTKETLPMIEKRINELITLKNSHVESNDLEMIGKIDAEIKQIKESVYSYKQNIEKSIKENNKHNIIQHTNDDVNVLDLEIDPRKNYLDLKNIIVKPKTDDKITEITLTKYFVPYNENNITRFNNKFNIYFNNKLWRITIPPSKYDMDTLLNYIKSEATFLDFSVDENGYITIKHKMDIKFDLMIDNDSVFTLLGFCEKVSTYKDNLFYTGTSKYNISPNDKIYFSLAGTPMEPLLLEFDKIVDTNISLRKSRAGINIKQLTLIFLDGNGQYYDLLMPFNVCMKITNVVKK